MEINFDGILSEEVLKFVEQRSSGKKNNSFSPKTLSAK